MENLSDLTIIGGGPTGLFAAFYAGLRHMKVRIVDSLPELGGQLTALYPEKYIYDVPGFSQILAKDLVAALTEQAMQYEPCICLSEKAQTLTKQADGTFLLKTDKGEHHSRAVLIAAGVGAFTPRRLDVARLDELEGKGVEYFVTDTSRYAGERILIVGGGDSAFDWALALGEKASACTLIHRSDKFRAHEDTIAKVLASPVDVRRFNELKTVHGNGHVEAVTVFDNRTGDEVTIECDHVLLNLGFLTNLGPLKDWGLEIQKNAIVVDSTMRTCIEGVYAAGDICTYNGKLKLIATGYGEAATAVCYAKTYIDPTAKAFPGHSSDMK